MNIIRPVSRWHSELESFLDTIPDLRKLGFPNNWKDFAPWKQH